MTSLPVLETNPFAFEREAVADALKWYDTIRKKMTAESSREWLEAALWKFLQQDIDRISRMNWGVVDGNDGPQRPVAATR
jgi:hypothetical protein